MNCRLPKRARIAAAALPTAATVLMLLVGADRAGAAANTACPAGFETIAVDDALNAGYFPIPVLTDESGNGDGVVCRRALGDGLFQLFPNAPVDQIYHWVDNATPR